VRRFDPIKHKVFLPRDISITEIRGGYDKEKLSPKKPSKERVNAGERGFAPERGGI